MAIMETHARVQAANGMGAMTDRDFLDTLEAAGSIPVSMVRSGTSEFGDARFTIHSAECDGVTGETLNRMAFQDRSIALVSKNGVFRIKPASGAAVSDEPVISQGGEERR